MSPSKEPPQPTKMGIMSSILVHLTHGPEHATRAALAFLVAKAAVQEGHQVTVFLAGDAVQIMRDGVRDSLVGLGTGSLPDHYNAVAASGAKIYPSETSSKARGLEVHGLQGKPVEMATPKVVVKLALENDRMFTYEQQGAPFRVAPWASYEMLRTPGEQDRGSPSVRGSKTRGTRLLGLSLPASGGAQAAPRGLQARGGAFTAKPPGWPRTGR